MSTTASSSCFRSGLEFGCKQYSQTPRSRVESPIKSPWLIDSLYLHVEPKCLPWWYKDLKTDIFNFLQAFSAPKSLLAALSYCYVMYCGRAGAAAAAMPRDITLHNLNEILQQYFSQKISWEWTYLWHPLMRFYLVTARWSQQLKNTTYELDKNRKLKQDRIWWRNALLNLVNII